MLNIFASTKTAVKPINYVFNGEIHFKFIINVSNFINILRNRYSMESEVIKKRGKNQQFYAS